MNRRQIVLVATASIALAGAAARSEEFEVQRGLRYAEHDGVNITGDLYTPKAPGPYPALVAVHGGAYQVGNARGYQFWGPYLAQRGYVLFAIDYRLVKDGKKMYPEAVHDVRAAVQFLRSRGGAVKVDPDRIGLIGDSAGGYFAALVALAGDKPPFVGAYKSDPYSSVSTRVKVCVGVYGHYDQAAAWQHALVNRPLDNHVEKFMGAKLIEDRKLYFEASPISYATRDKSLGPYVLGETSRTSFLLTWGTADDVNPPSESEAFLLALKQAGFAPVQTVVLPGASHFWMGDPIEEPGTHTGFLAPRLLRFLQRQL